MMVATGTFLRPGRAFMQWILQLLLLQVLSTSTAAQLTSYVKVERGSVDSLNNQADAESGAPSVSGNGRYVAFWSRASNLVAGDTNGHADVFVRDRLLAITERVSVDSAGSQANGSSDVPSLSADGRCVAFGSDASDLVDGDTNQSQDVFVHDRLSGTTERISISTAGGEGNSHSISPSISADGHYVAFGSTASNLAAGDTNGQQDVYVRDRISGTTLRVSVDTGSGEGPYDSNSPSISPDGRYVAFVSNNRFAGRRRGGRDIFVRDLQTATTELVSLDNAGREGMADSISPFISAEGRYVVFESAANLVDGGTNGPRTDVFIRDRLLRTTERVSAGRDGVTANGSALPSNPSADARYVAFWSDATNLVAEDNNGAFDAFVRDRATRTTLRVSINAANRGEGNANTLFPSISADGHHVAFVSLASNLVAGDTNERTYSSPVNATELPVATAFWTLNVSNATTGTW